MNTEPVNKYRAINAQEDASYYAWIARQTKNQRLAAMYQSDAAHCAAIARKLMGMEA
jgi:hypothetical protein